MTAPDRRLHSGRATEAGVPARIRVGATALRPEPAPDVAIDSELLFGEPVTVFEEREGWAFVRSRWDGYVGWCSGNALDRAWSPAVPATHRVAALRTYLYPAPTIKLGPLDLLSLNSQVTVTGTEGEFAITDTGFYVVARHLAPAGEHDTDHVAVAERFLGTPYLWGGRTSVGLDCSGLVQMALVAAGVGCPRDSDMQEGRTAAEAPGQPIPIDDPSTFGRGDLLFWAGHVAIVSGPNRLFHANAFHMTTEVEPLDAALARIADAGLPLRSARRVAG